MSAGNDLRASAAARRKTPPLCLHNCVHTTTKATLQIESLLLVLLALLLVLLLLLLLLALLLVLVAFCVCQQGGITTSVYTGTQPPQPTHRM